MKTDIYPNDFITGQSGEQVPGFRVGREFVPMSPHKGHVAMLPTANLRHRFVKGGNNKQALYSGQHYRLEIRTVEQPVTDDELIRVLASRNERLVIIDNRNKIG